MRKRIFSCSDIETSYFCLRRVLADVMARGWGGGGVDPGGGGGGGGNRGGDRVHQPPLFFLTWIFTYMYIHT